MDKSYALNSQDISRIEKLNKLTEPESFWDKFNDLAKTVKSDSCKSHWRRLAHARFYELTNHQDKPFEVILYKRSVSYGCSTRSYCGAVLFRKVFSNKYDMIYYLNRIDRYEGSACSIWQKDNLLYAGQFDLSKCLKIVRNVED